jgi:hypothetical protein
MGGEDGDGFGGGGDRWVLFAEEMNVINPLTVAQAGFPTCSSFSLLKKQ